LLRDVGDVRAVTADELRGEVGVGGDAVFRPNSHGLRRVSVRGSGSAAALAGVAFTWSRSRLGGRGRAGAHSPLPDERAADVVWILNDAALYRSLVTDRGWPEPEYTAWLARTLRAQLLR
jgi:hypothetical protein